MAESPSVVHKVGVGDGTIKEASPSASAVCDESTVGGLIIEAAHRRLLWNVCGNDSQEWWAILAPLVRRVRAEAGGDSTIYEHFQWLVGIMAGMDRRAGVPPIFDEASVASWREARITQHFHQLRVEQALRTVIIAAPDAGAVGGPPDPATAPAPAPAPAAQP